MRIRILLVIQVILIPVLFSCKASKHLTSSTRSASSKSSNLSLSAAEEYYINTYRDIAVGEMKRTGIPASITLAQGMIESDYGRSTLAKDANNHFGIKCHNDWTGPKVYHHDDGRDECFRKYNKPEDSFYDHSEFLKSASRYRFLFDLSPTDYKGWAQGLKKAGYATNPEYANMLIRTIEEKNLGYYDTGSVPPAASKVKPPQVSQPVTVQDSNSNTIAATPVNSKGIVFSRVPQVQENNKLRYVVVRDGDTREKLEEEFNLLHWELPRYNELPADFTLSPGQILYLQAKKDKAEAGKDVCTVTPGDTMYLISQKYGIKLKSLYKMNRMEENTEPQPGSTIWLRDMKPVN
jgi:LysM repeat protein